MFDNFSKKFNAASVLASAPVNYAAALIARQVDHHEFMRQLDTDAIEDRNERIEAHHLEATEKIATSIFFKSSDYCWGVMQSSLNHVKELHCRMLSTFQANGENGARGDMNHKTDFLTAIKYHTHVYNAIRDHAGITASSKRTSAIKRLTKKAQGACGRNKTADAEAVIQALQQEMTQLLKQFTSQSNKPGASDPEGVFKTRSAI